MIENCDIRIQGQATGIELAADDRKLFPRRPGKPKAAICPRCGEVSIYLDNPKQINH